MYVPHAALPMTALDHVNSLREFLAGHCLSRHHLVDVVSQPVDNLAVFWHIASGSRPAHMDSSVTTPDSLLQVLLAFNARVIIY